MVMAATLAIVKETRKGSRPFAEKVKGPIPAIKEETTKRWIGQQ